MAFTYHCVLVALTLRLAPTAKSRVLFGRNMERPALLLVFHQFLEPVLPLRSVDCPKLEFEADILQRLHPFWGQ